MVAAGQATKERRYVGCFIYCALREGAIYETALMIFIC